MQQTFHSEYLFNKCKKMMKRKGFCVATLSKDYTGIRVKWRKI